MQHGLRCARHPLERVKIGKRRRTYEEHVGSSLDV
jgi:hypothetical protein